MGPAMFRGARVNFAVPDADFDFSGSRQAWTSHGSV
jgi:hypothetical protein